MEKNTNKDVQKGEELSPLVFSTIENTSPSEDFFPETRDLPVLPKINIDALPKSDIQSEINELQQSLSLVRATLESTADGILMIDCEGKVTGWNHKFIEMWKMPIELLESGDEEPCFHFVLNQVKDPDELFREVTKLYDNPFETGNLGEVAFKDGRIFERYSQPHRVGEKIVGRVWSFRDITTRRQAEEAVRLRERAIESSSHGILIFEKNQDAISIVYANTAFEKITGFSEAEILEKDITVLVNGDKTEMGIQKIRVAMSDFREIKIELECEKKEGDLYWAEIHFSPVLSAEKEVNHFVAIITDITLRRKMEEQLLNQATHDTLTNLPNRSLLLDRIEQSILQAKRHHGKLGLMFIDLDQFKLINDSLGHTTGDKLLQLVAKRLLGEVRVNDTVARIGGDEFVILVSELEKEEDSIFMAQKILNAISLPYEIDGATLTVTASLGLSFFPKDGDDFENLLRSADLSMYEAKEAGRNNFKLYNSEMNAKVKRRLMIENRLRNALEKEEFHLVYQPIYNFSTSKIELFEVLLRWTPDGESISPMEFIPIAEETGLIIPIGGWVLSKAIDQLNSWHAMGHDKLRIAVNISARQFKQGNLIELISKLHDEKKFPLHCLELELTETMLIENAEETIEILKKFKLMGLTLSIDDFGTGYSSLNYLKQFPVDVLKIDKSFVTEIKKENNDGAITNAIIQLGHSLKLKVLAEGIEDDYQHLFLRAQGCDYGQGYLFSKPLRAQEFEETLRLEIEKLKK